MLWPELISKLNFLDEDEQEREQTLSSSNPFEEPDDPEDLNPFGEPDEEGKEMTFNPLRDPGLKRWSHRVNLVNERPVFGNT